MTAPVWAADIARSMQRWRRDSSPTSSRRWAARVSSPSVSAGTTRRFSSPARLSFAFPGGRIVADLIEREIALLPNLAPRLPIAISAPRSWCGEYHLPVVVSGYPLIRRDVQPVRGLSPTRSGSALAQPLARFLRALHSIDPTTPVALGLPPGRTNGSITTSACAGPTSVYRRSASGRSTRWALGRLPRRGLQGAPRPVGRLERRQNGPPSTGLLSASRSVLGPKRSQSAGVIDWGDLQSGAIRRSESRDRAHLMLPAAAQSDVSQTRYGLDR